MTINEHRWRLGETEVAAHGEHNTGTVAQNADDRHIHAVPEHDTKGVDTITTHIGHLVVALDLETPTLKDTEVIDCAIDNTESRIGSLYDIALESREAPYTGKYVSGPRRDAFRTVLFELEAELQAINPLLTLENLHDVDYQQGATRKNTIEYLRRGHEEFTNLYHGKATRLEKVADSDDGHVLPVGILDTPPYAKQHDSRACVNAVFRMILQAITNEDIREVDLDSAMFRAYRSTMIGDEEYLKLLETSSLEEQYSHGRQIRSIQFMGMSFDSLAAIATKLKAKQPGTAVYTVANLKTEYPEYGPNIQHRVMLLGADSATVTFHDPHRKRGVAERKIKRSDFLRRWAAAQNTGCMVIVK